MLLAYTVSAFQVYGAPTVTPGGLLLFSTHSEFEQALPGLPLEDFEESTIGDTSAGTLVRPLDSSTSNAYFSAGDIQDGLTITASGTLSPGSELVIAGGNHLTWNNTSKAISNNNLFNLFTIEFSDPDVNAVGMDLVFITSTGNAEMKIYTTGDTLIDTVIYALGATPTFFGIYSVQPITKITMTKTPNDNWVSIDNIQFGAVTSNLTFYTDQTAFEAAYPGLPVEDFEESPVAPGSQVIFGEPLENITNAPGAFAPGDIMDDIHVKTVFTATPSTALNVLGENYASLMGNPSKLVCSSAGLHDDLQIMLYNLTASGVEIDTYALGMDLMQWHPSTYPPADCVIAVYDITGRLLGSTKMAVLAGKENFIGVFSKQPFLKVTMQFTGDDHECVDNIQFGGSPRGLTFYSTEADFTKARNNLPKEDFSKSPVTATGPPLLCDEPIDSTTNQAGCFSPGDILPNITFQTEESLSPFCPNCLGLYGPNTGILGNATPFLAVNPPDLLEISFSGQRVHYAGMNLYLITLVSIYGPDDTLLGTTISYPAAPIFTFKGVRSFEPISRITITGVSGPSVLDYIMFGGKFPWAMYQPAINGGAGASGP